MYASASKFKQYVVVVPTCAFGFSAQNRHDPCHLSDINNKIIFNLLGPIFLCKIHIKLATGVLSTHII